MDRTEITKEVKALEDWIEEQLELLAEVHLGR